MLPNNFFIQLLARLLSGKPKFFKWIQIASVALGALSAALNFLPADFTPPFLEGLKSNVVWVSSIVAAIIAQLPVKDPYRP